MGLDIKVEENFLELANAFNELSAQEIAAAGRRALNKTLLTLRQASVQEIAKKVKLKPSTLRERYIWLEKARGGNFNSLQASVCFSSKPVPLLEFVRGSKEPIQQKGIPVKRRRKLRVEITPGKKFILPKAFIQRVKTTQVFKRKHSGGFATQAVRSVGFLVKERGIGERLVALGQNRLLDLLNHELNFQLLKAQGKLNSNKIGS